MDQLFTLHNILNLRKLEGKGTVICFIDLVKAYDTVWRKGLLVKMARMGVTGKIWKMIDSIFQDFHRKMHHSTSPKDDLASAKVFNIKDFGLPQGAPESCSLFNIFIDDLPKILERHQIGVLIDGVRISSLLIADDIVVITKNEAEMQLALNLISDYTKKWKLAINGHPKSALMVIGNKKFKERVKKTVFTCDGKPIVPVKDYKYLGVWMSDDLSWNKHVNFILKRARANAGVLMLQMRRDAKVRPRTAIYLFNAIVRPRLEFGCEVWSMSISKAKQKEIQSVFDDFNRRLLSMPSRIPQAFINFELGSTRLLARHHKLTFDYFMKTSAHRPNRLNHVTLSSLLSSARPTVWERGFRDVLSSLALNDLPPRGSAVQILRSFCEGSVNLISLDEREEMFVRSSLENCQSLHLHAAVRNHEDISKGYAWAKTHIGRKSHRQFQHYLDNWRDQGKTAKLKLLARADSLMLRAQQRRFYKLDRADGCCNLCDSSVQQTLLHLCCDCHSTTHIRSSLYNKVLAHLASCNRGPKLRGTALQPEEFDAFDNLNKFYVCLGKPTGCLKADMRIDASFRTFLRKLHNMVNN